MRLANAKRRYAIHQAAGSALINLQDARDIRAGKILGVVTVADHEETFTPSWGIFHLLVAALQAI